MNDKLEMAMKATPPEDLYEYLMDSSIPKSEAEHFAADRIAELEAKLRIQEEQSFGLLKPLQAKLDRVRGLPEKWRDISYKTTDAYTNLHGCADELQSALGDDEFHAPTDQ